MHAEIKYTELYLIRSLIYMRKIHQFLSSIKRDVCKSKPFFCLTVYNVMNCNTDSVSGIKGSPNSITKRRVPELIPVLGSQPAGDVSHEPDGRLPLPSARPAVTPATLKRAATSFAAW